MKFTDQEWLHDCPRRTGALNRLFTLAGFASRPMSVHGIETRIS